MKIFKNAVLLSFTTICAIVLSGCASSLPPEQQKNYALLVPEERTGGLVNSTMISAIDGESFYSLAGGTQDVLPGKHEITIRSCFNGSSTNCPERHYTLETKAGLAYIFQGQDILVFDRFNRAQPLEILRNMMR
jgi:hypothetical protein